MLKSIDLFSGIGGITRALHGLAEPIAYCDWAEESQRTLATLMSKRKLPKAPICPDVRLMNRSWLRRECRTAKIDMIVGGFPCVGFSLLGHKEAFDNEESGMFREILRLADETRCPMLFLENVPSILSLGMEDIVRELMTVRGYELRYTIVSAEMMGAPHKRSRWFCLAVRPGFKMTWEHKSTYTAYPWLNTKEPARATNEMDMSERDAIRTSMLGNSVVPDAVRYAFLFLVSRCSIVPKSLNTPARFSLAPPRDAVHGQHSEWPSTGIVDINGNIAKVRSLGAFREPFNQGLVFDPKVFETSKAPSPHLTTGILTEPVKRDLWATPRHKNTRAANYLTHRGVKDLGTQIRFERGTRNELRGGHMTPEFVEYLMGYEIGWTSYR